VPPAPASPDFDARRTTCPLCDGGPLQHRLTDCRGHGIDRCTACGVEFMNPQYSDEALQRLYAGYISLHPNERDERFRCRAEVRRVGKRRSMQLLARHAPGRRILMVGCGDGLELREALACGWQPEGFDVDPATTAAVARAVGVPVHCGDFHELPRAAAEFDAVFLDQVLEHPKDPGRYLHTCLQLLRPGGVAFLGMPNLGSISNVLKTQADRLGLRPHRGRHYNTRHHLTFFKPAVLVRHLRNRLGMEVLRVGTSLKPQRNPLVRVLGHVSTVFDSSFFVIARRPARGEQPEPVRAAAAVAPPASAAVPAPAAVASTIARAHVAADGS
jgi:2-polyprenyl-3-methyl-5-hydroxy-6-metoxy-1,4-benzoquinol methylase